MHMKKNRALKTLVLSGAVLGLLFFLVDTRALLDALARTDWRWYMAGFACYLASYYTRALRLRTLYGACDVTPFLAIVAASTLANQILPFRTGELTLPYLIRAVKNESFGVALGYLALLRIADLLVLMACGLAVVALLGASVTPATLVGLAAALALLALCFARFGTLLRWGLALARRILPHALRSRLDNRTAQIAESLVQARQHTRRIVLLSLADRLANTAVGVTLVLGMAYDIRPLEAAAATLVAALTNILPVNTLGNFGTLELGWTGTLATLGVDAQAALTSGLAFHLLFLTYTFAAGIGALAWILVRHGVAVRSSWRDMLGMNANERAVEKKA